MSLASDPIFSLLVPGRPVPQGSLTLWRGDDGKERVKYSSTTVNHRNLVVGMVTDSWAGAPPLDCPVEVELTFTFQWLRAHLGTGKNHGQVKTSAPEYVTTTPDLDKLVRLACDALAIGGVLRNDSLVARLHAEKRYGDSPSTMVKVWVIT